MAKRSPEQYDEWETNKKLSEFIEYKGHFVVLDDWWILTKRQLIQKFKEERH